MIAKLTTKKMIAAYVAIAAAIAAHLGFDLDETVAAIVLTAVLTAIGVSKPRKPKDEAPPAAPDGFIRTTLLLVMLPFALLVAVTMLATSCTATKAGARAAASSFSDWWAYKIEVMDAIPWNGTMLHRAGVLVSFNSDSDELARIRR